MRHLSLLLISLSLLFTSCESHKSPTETVRAYLAATNSFDFQTAEKLIIPNKENLHTLENLKISGEKMSENEKRRFFNQEKDCIYYEKEITDSVAQLIVTPNQDIVLPIEFNLKKVNGNWLIESVISH